MDSTTRGLRIKNRNNSNSVAVSSTRWPARRTSRAFSSIDSSPTENTLLSATWDGGRVGPAERERLSALVWGRLDTSGVEATPFTTSTDSSSSMRADGNNVDVDTESANLAKNQLLFDSVMAIDTKRLHTMDTAITGAH